MRWWMIAITVFAAAGLTFSVIGLVTHASRLRAGGKPRVLQPDEYLSELVIPRFAMLDQDGRPRTEQMFDGQVTVLDFIFTHCPFACPIMTTAIGELAQHLAGTPVRFVSVSVDPVRDTPERLREFAGDHDADLSRWTFLTGDEATVKGIVRDAFKFSLGPDETRKITLPDGSQMANISHPTKLILIGPDRHVLGLYDPNIPGDLDQLRIRAKLAAEEVEKLRSK